MWLVVSPQAGIAHRVIAIVADRAAKFVGAGQSSELGRVQIVTLVLAY